MLKIIMENIFGHGDNLDFCLICNLCRKINISVTPLSVYGHTVKNYEPTRKFFAGITKKILENEDSML